MSAITIWLEAGSPLAFCLTLLTVALRARKEDLPSIVEMIVKAIRGKLANC